MKEIEENEKLREKIEREYRFDITKEFIQNLPLSGYQGRITLINKQEDVRSAVQELRKYSIIGFDTESRPSFKKGEKHPISLIQLASPHMAYLFRVNRTGMTDEIRRLLKDRIISKVGLGLHQELKEIFRGDAPEEGIIDLELIARNNGFKKRGVKALAAHFLGIRISKSAQKTNWERRELTEKQQRYAATDAWICLKIYEKMLEDPEIDIHAPPRDFCPASQCQR